jgi:hypothetical protein
MIRTPRTRGSTGGILPEYVPFSDEGTLMFAGTLLDPTRLEAEPESLWRLAPDGRRDELPFLVARDEDDEEELEDEDEGEEENWDEEEDLDEDFDEDFDEEFEDEDIEDLDEDEDFDEYEEDEDLDEEDEEDEDEDWDEGAGG